MPRLSTIGISALAAIILPMAGLLAIARMEDWSFNWTTCLPLGFYEKEPAPHPALKDGDMVEVCPSTRNPLHLSFVGFPAFQKAVPAEDNPAMLQAVRGLWLLHEPHGPCTNSLMPFAKIVAATAGQFVRITPQGVYANGDLLPNSRVVDQVDGISVIHLPYGEYRIPKGYFWDYAPGNFAFTSAYYGPVPLSHILARLHPVLVIPGSQHWYHPETKG
ncbi:conjugal transfer protein [Acidithiobacillus thiooxidans]|uniref:Conjugal transfer protein n=3 Tax=Acidithiobacillus TaxID=119977 RepID=A0A1C2HWR0_ACITH|nr:MULTISPECIES: S26 family signal peptidase [Acidithiobacillus]MBU2761087.1 conjugal transfer protein [Acidithiobacillus sulfurivorans]MBU2836957.1 conjugal transfer protein [Acidithiobacillus thiooxidans]MBU2840253.1 conjugal transfer protein [Acidithiobacillus thiooxidans]OCX68193.1 conjugal transfer protein [Acidithiobacillus thiooxidans]OCX82296.1 conjugal transfer protein [Acidithiobacillus thiooxidans]